MVKDDELLSISKAANMLGASTYKIREWDRSGELKAIKTQGNHRRYRLADIKDFEDKQLVSISKAANMLGVSVDKLRDWDESGELKPIKTLGNHRRYRPVDIQHNLLNRSMHIFRCKYPIDETHFIRESVMITNDKFYTPIELAQILKISASTIRRWCKLGSIPVVKIGKQIRIPASVVKTMLTCRFETYYHKSNPADLVGQAGLDDLIAPDCPK